MGYYKREDEVRVISCINSVFHEASIYRDDFILCFSDIRNFSNELYLHSIKVALMSLIMGVRHYQRSHHLKELFLAAMLHDYGKIYISRCILEKRGPLTEDERKTIELHSIAGYFYLKKRTRFNDRILDAVLDHHEKVDGSGYGLCKTTPDICEYAKYIAIADVYDAMISERVYRGPLEKETAANYLIDNAGKHFDEKLVKEFITLVNEKEVDCLIINVISEIESILGCISRHMIRGY